MKQDPVLSFVPPAVDAYCIEKSNPASANLQSLEKFTRENVEHSVMLTGPLEAALLGFLCRLVNAKHVLEFGTYTGYSALAMAEALPADGSVTTLDIDPENTAIAQKHWAQSPHGSKIHLHLGPATETVKSLEGPFDLVFIDADKPGYWAYFQAALARLSPGGLIAVDNCLLRGEALDGATRSVQGQAIHDFNNRVSALSNLDRVLLPIRDGLYLLRKRLPA